MNSLLAQFYHRIKGSQEDIASEGLVYILQQSLESRKSVNQIIKLNTNLIFSDLSYKSQVTGKKMERPDISGRDITGKEVLLIEAKFWASLSENQPKGYINRLNDNTVLLFIVPSLRTKVVFEEVKNRISEDYVDLKIDLENLTILIKESNKHILVKSWSEILNSLKAKIEETKNITLLSDLNQIIGLCNKIDQNSFQPITDDDLSPRIPKCINSYFEIVDKVVDTLKSRNSEISTVGLLKTPQRYGYHRYFRTKELGMTLGLKLDLWEKFSDTPFWLGIDNKSDMNIEKIIHNIPSLYNLTMVPFTDGSGVFLNLKPKLYETEDIVIKNLADKTQTIISEVTNFLNSQSQTNLLF